MKPNSENIRITKQNLTMKDSIATYHKPLRITIEHHDMKVSVETDHSDLDAEEFGDMLMYAAKACGWTDKQVNQIFNIQDNENQHRKIR